MTIEDFPARFSEPELVNWGAIPESVDNCRMRQLSKILRLQRRILDGYAIRSPRQFPYARRIQRCHAS